MEIPPYFQQAIHQYCECNYRIAGWFGSGFAGRTLGAAGARAAVGWPGGAAGLRRQALGAAGGLRLGWSFAWLRRGFGIAGSHCLLHENVLFRR